MIIGIDASRANTDHRTGTEWYSFHVIQELKKIIPAEHTVRVYVKEALKKDLLPLPSNWEVRVLGWRPGLFWTQLRLSIEMLFHSPDVLYVPAHTIPVISPKNTVTVIHDVGFVTHPELYSASELRYHRFSLRLAVKKARELITISDFSKKEIGKIAPQIHNRLHKIYNGLHVRNIEPDNSILERFQLRDKKILLTIGRVEEKKNSPRLAEAFAAYATAGDPSAVLVFAGGAGFGASAIQDFIKERQLENRVIFTGYLSDAEIVALLQHAHAFVFPSLYEGFGMPILEAFSYGLPVICSNIEPLREIGGETAVYFDPYSTTEITHAIEHAINTTMTAKERDLQKTAGKVYIERFSWEQTAGATWKIIEAMVL